MSFLYLFPASGDDIEFTPFTPVTGRKIQPSWAPLPPGLLAALDSFWTAKGPHLA